MGTAAPKVLLKLYFFRKMLFLNRVILMKYCNIKTLNRLPLSFDVDLIFFKQKKIGKCPKSELDFDRLN